MKFITLFREVQPGDGTAGGTTSLASILNTNGSSIQEGLEEDGVTLKPGYTRDAISGKVGKDPAYKDPAPGTKPPVQNQQQQQSQLEYVTDDVALNADKTLKPGYLREAGTDKIYKDPEYKAPAAPIEGLNADGTLQPGYKKNDDGTIVKDPEYVDPDDDEDPEDETGLKFIGAVEAITGRKYDITYPDGVTPTTPEGIAFRENVIRENAMQEFEVYLQKKDARAYAYFLHRAAGGNDDTFYGDQKGFQLPDQAALKASADLQSQVYTQDLLGKGLDGSAVKILVEAAVKDNTLEKKATDAWTAIDKAQKDQLAQLQADEKKAEEKFNSDLQVMTAGIMKTMKEEIAFVVPETDQAAFQKFILENMRYENGEFFIVQPVSKENFKTSIEAMFFQYKKGDLKTLVAKQARTEASQKLKLKLKSNSNTPGSGTGDSNNNTKNLPLSAII